MQVNNELTNKNTAPIEASDQTVISNHAPTKAFDQTGLLTECNICHNKVYFSSCKSYTRCSCGHIIARDGNTGPFDDNLINVSC